MMKCLSFLVFICALLLPQDGGTTRPLISGGNTADSGLSVLVSGDLTLVTLAGSTTKFFREDGVFAVPPSGGGGLDAGVVVMILSGACPSGFTEVAALNGKMLRGTVAANADVGTTGGSDTFTPVGTNSAPTISGSSAGESSHTHSVTSNVTVPDHAAHTHSVTSNVTVADHGAHTHTFTQSSNANSPDLLTSLATGAAVAASGTTGNPSATLTHVPTNNAVTSGNPSATLTHAPVNNAVTSAAGSSHLHGAGTLVSGAPTFTGTGGTAIPAHVKVIFCSKD